MSTAPQPNQPRVPPVVAPAAQPNIVQSRPHNNLPNVPTVPTVQSNIVNVNNGTPIPPWCSFSPAAHSIAATVAALDVNIITPVFERGIFPYRNHIVARLSLTGTVYHEVLLGPSFPNKSQLLLWCYAECSLCSSSRRPQCSPVGWYLDPLFDHKHNQGFRRDPGSGSLTGNVSFTIEHRPRRPKAQGQMRRCASGSLVLTFSLCDYAGRTVIEKQVGPFRERSHAKKLSRNDPSQRHALVPRHLPNRGVHFPAVPSLPFGAQMLPAGYTASVYRPAYPPSVYPPPVYRPVYPPPPYPPPLHPPSACPPVYPPPVYLPPVYPPAHVQGPAFRD